MSMDMVTHKNKDPLDLMDLTVAFTTGKINPKRNLRLLLPKSNSNLIDTICKVDIGQQFEDFTGSCLNKDFPTDKFNEIKARNETIEYERQFERNLSKRNWFLRYKGSQLQYMCPRKCQYQVHQAHIREGIRRICHKLIPSQVIGSNRNKIKIFKALQNLLQTAETEPFNLLNLVKSLNLESITWVLAMNERNDKFILIGKFIKWLFQVFIVIIEKVFHVSHVRGEKVFIFIKDWEAQKDDHVKLMCQRSTLQLIGAVDEFTETCYNRLYFIPKLANLRPITIFKHTDEEMQLLRQIVALLYYLCKKNYPKSEKPFNEKLIEIFQDCNCNGNGIFAVSCDIVDAYGSILQGKLFDIIKKMFVSLPDKVKLKFQTVRNVKRYQVITDDINEILYDPQKVEIVDKDVLMQVLKNLIFQTHVMYKNKLYNINRGVTQGLITSAILCTIYYAQMNRKYFADLETNGNLFNYVDDYLYTSIKLDVAKKFLKKVEEGIPEYNCLFKESKVNHNLTLKNSQCVTYLGWRINLQHLKIEPKYNSTRYSMQFKSLNTGSFEFKLKQHTSLKLNKLIFTKKIYTSDQIFQNIELVCQRQAERCFALSSCLYATRQEIVSIKSIIRANGFLVRKIQRMTEWDKLEISQNRQIVELIIWQRFFHLFARRRDIFPSLVMEFKKLFKHYKKKCQKKN